jgi:hypothetical protein
MGEELRPNSLPLGGGASVGVANERNIADVLKPHHSEENSVFKRAPEYNPIVDFLTQLGGRHVGFLPPVRRDVFAIYGCRIVDYVADPIELLCTALPDIHQFRLRFELSQKFRSDSQSR